MYKIIYFFSYLQEIKKKQPCHYQLIEDMMFPWGQEKLYRSRIIIKLLKIHLFPFLEANECPILPCYDGFVVSFPLCCSVIHILQKNKTSSASHTKGHAHYVDNWHGLSREPESDDGAVVNHMWLSFSVAGTSPALGCYDTRQRQRSYGTLWHKQLSTLQSTRNI